MSENLWPIDFGRPAQKPPIAILREQGQVLGDLTANVVAGKVSSGSAGEGRFRHLFYLYSSPLRHSIELLWIEHGIEPYPVEIHSAGEANAKLVAADPEQFAAHLKEFFAREKTKTAVASLLAQSQE